MLYLVVNNITQNINLNYLYIFINYKVKIINQHELHYHLNYSSTYLFANNFLYPKKNFINIIKNLDFCNLSNDKSIFVVKGYNIKIIDNTIEIKKNNNSIILFDETPNEIDNIIPPKDLNLDYLLVLKQRTYDKKININFAYKAYEKFLKYVVKNNYCYNIIYWISNINQLIDNNGIIQLPKYNFYRITIFHNFKNELDLQILKLYCNKNNILSCYYLIKPSVHIFEINNLRSIWFEKIIIVKNKTLVETINLIISKLNDYHSIFNSLILDNIISIDTTQLIKLPFSYNFDSKLLDFTFEIFFDLIKNYALNNLTNCYILNQKKNKYPLIFKDLPNFNEKNSLIIRDYNTIVINITNKIKNNNDMNQLANLVIKKISIGTLCRDESDLIKDVNIIIDSINDFGFLQNLVLLLTNFKNPKIIAKLYCKIIKLSIESNISKITLQCFQYLLTTQMDDSTIIVILDFIDFLFTNNLFLLYGLDENKVKNIVISLFYTITRYFDNNIIIDRFTCIINKLFNINDLLSIDKLLSINLVNKNDKFCNFSLVHFIIFSATNFSAYYDSNEEFINKRIEIKYNLETLITKDLPLCSLKEVTYLPVNNFFLSYQGVNSVEIFKLKTQLIRKICPQLNYKIDTDFKNKKINICFHSNFLNRWHSVFKDRHQIIKALADNSLFNVYFSTFDDLKDDVKFMFGKAIHIKLDNIELEDIKKIFINLKLDVLVYCEIGMDPKSYFMAFMRLAKIQINTWGHSDTSGIDTIDYFFSSKLYELPYEQAQTHYSERLILLDSLCTTYINPLARYNLLNFKNRYTYGFTDEVTIFFCAQSLFKFNPEFDDFIINILDKNPNYILLLLDNNSKEKVIKRFNNKNITSRIHIFPNMSHESYLNLIKISDIILDPYPFGGCNSSLEAFALNKVVVTCASQMINGRFTCGFYKKMGLDNMITENKETYVNLALKLANDILYRKQIENQIKHKNNLLFNDLESIEEWTNKIIDLFQSVTSSE